MHELKVNAFHETVRTKYQIMHNDDDGVGSSSNMTNNNNDN